MAGLLALVFMGLVPGLTPPPSPRRPPSGPMPRDACPAEQAARWTGYPLDAPGRGGPGTSRSTASRVPEVTHEWPAEAPRHAVEPLDVPVLAAAAAGLAATILLVPSIDDRGGVLLAALLVCVCSATICLVASLWAMPPEGRALRRAGWDVRGGEPPMGIIGRLRRVDLQGRPRLHRDLAVRCLERSELSHVQERVLREQAYHWIERARNGLNRSVKR